MLKLLTEIIVFIAIAIIILKIIFPLIKNIVNYQRNLHSTPDSDKKSFDETVDDLNKQKTDLKERKEGLDKDIDEKVEKVTKLKD